MRFPCATGRGASGPAGWVLTRRRGGAEKEAEKQGKEGAKFTRSQGGGASGERGGRRPSSARLKPAPQLAPQHFLQGLEGDGPGDAGSVVALELHSAPHEGAAPPRRQFVVGALSERHGETDPLSGRFQAECRVDGIAERGEIGTAQNRQSGVHAGAETQRRR